MEQSLSSLLFTGSIIEAITEAKRQKKLFVVYVSGGNMESNQLETSTWLDSRVADSISKYCILLRILEGSIDAVNFSALYPQKTAPCITAIGYNGVQLWQHEGFVSPDVLASSLEKAWLSLHIQETTATLLTAALASKSELVSGASCSASSEAGSSSNAQIPSAEMETPMAIASRNSGHAITERDSMATDMASHGSDAVESRVGEFNEAPTPITIAEKPLDLVEVVSTKTEDGSSMSKEKPDLCDSLMQPSEEASGDIANKARQAPEINIVEDAAAEKTDVSDSLAYTSNDIYFNIRLPEGSSLQVKFLVTDSLGMVKHYVDKNKTSSFGSYDLAVPYPRKVFGDEDLDRTLSDLGLCNRQALIVVPRNKVNTSSHGKSSSANTLLHGQSSSAESNSSASGSNEGYFAMIRRLFSYVNPFSYLGGDSSSSNSAQESQNYMQQYGQNPTPQNNQTLAGRPYNTRTTTTTDNNRIRRPTSSRFGSNIHTLKHDEDDKGFGDKNAFWNGNSTQFGGNDNNKKD